MWCVCYYYGWTTLKVSELWILNKSDKEAIDQHIVDNLQASITRLAFVYQLRMNETNEKQPYDKIIKMIIKKNNVKLI